MGEADTGQRIGSFSGGMGIAALFAFLAWLSFCALTMMMDPALAGSDYWAAVGERARSNPMIATFLALCLLGVLAGVLLMGRAVIGRPQRHAEPGAAADGGA